MIPCSSVRAAPSHMPLPACLPACLPARPPAGKLNGLAVRVPLTNASITDCVFEVKARTTAEAVNLLLKVQGCGVWGAGHGVRVVGCGMWSAGCGVRGAGCGVCMGVRCSRVRRAGVGSAVYSRGYQHAKVQCLVGLFVSMQGLMPFGLFVIVFLVFLGVYSENPETLKP